MFLSTADWDNRQTVMLPSRHSWRSRPAIIHKEGNISVGHGHLDTWTLGHLDTYLNIAGVLWSGACGQWRACRGPHWSSRCWRVSRTPCDSPCQSWTPGTLRSCSWSPPDSPGTGWLPCSQHWTLGWHGETYIGKSPSTRQMYSFLTCLVLIWVSISRALPGFLPNISSPEVRRSSLETQWSGVTWQE